MNCRTCGAEMVLCETCPGTVWVCPHCGNPSDSQIIEDSPTVEDNPIPVLKKDYGLFIGDALRVELEEDFYLEMEVGLGVALPGSPVFFPSPHVEDYFVPPLKSTYLAQYAAWKGREEA